MHQRRPPEELAASFLGPGGVLSTLPRRASVMPPPPPSGASILARAPVASPAAAAPSSYPPPPGPGLRPHDTSSLYATAASVLMMAPAASSYSSSSSSSSSAALAPGESVGRREAEHTDGGGGSQAAGPRSLAALVVDMRLRGETVYGLMMQQLDAPGDADLLGEAFRLARTWAQTAPVSSAAFGFAPEAAGGATPAILAARLAAAGALVTVIGGTAAGGGAVVKIKEEAARNSRPASATSFSPFSPPARTAPRKITHPEEPAAPVLFLVEGQMWCGHMPRQSASLTHEGERHVVSVIPTYAQEAMDVPVEDVVTPLWRSVPPAPPSTYRVRLRFDEAKKATIPERRYPLFARESASGVLAVRLAEYDAAATAEGCDEAAFLRRLREDLSDTWLERALRAAGGPAAAAEARVPMGVEIAGVTVLTGEPRVDLRFRTQPADIHRDFFVTQETEDPELGARQLEGHRAALLGIAAPRETIKYAHRLAARGWRVMCPANAAQLCTRQKMYELRWPQDGGAVAETVEALQAALTHAESNVQAVLDEMAVRNAHRVLRAEGEGEGGASYDRLLELRTSLVRGEARVSVPEHVPDVLASDLPGTSRYFYEAAETQRRKYTWPAFASSVFVRVAVEEAAALGVTPRSRGAIAAARERLRDVFDPLRSYLSLCAEVMLANAGGRANTPLVVPEGLAERVHSILTFNTSARMTGAKGAETMDLAYWLELHADPETMPVRDTHGRPVARTLLRAVASFNLRYGQFAQVTRRYEFHQPTVEARRVFKTVREGCAKMGGGAEEDDREEDEDEGRKLRAKFVETMGYGPDIKIIAEKLKTLEITARAAERERSRKRPAGGGARSVPPPAQGGGDSTPRTPLAPSDRDSGRDEGAALGDRGREGAAAPLPAARPAAPQSQPTLQTSLLQMWSSRLHVPAG